MKFSAPFIATIMASSANKFADADYTSLSASAASASSKSGKSGAGTGDGHCRDDVYAWKFDEEERTFSDDGLTARTSRPLYAYVPCLGSDDGTCPDFSTAVGEYNSVSSIIPARIGFGAGTGFTCQQQAMIGLNLVGTEPAFYEDQLMGSGICFSEGPESAIEKSYAATGGIGIYGGASGRVDLQCFPNNLTYCAFRVRVCGDNVEPNNE